MAATSSAARRCPRRWPPSLPADESSGPAGPPRPAGVADWVCPGRAPYLTPQASRSTHASRAGPAGAAAATAAGPPDADPGRADRLPAPPAGAAALRRAAVTGDTHPPPGHTAWMSQPCRSHGVDVASTPYHLARGGARVTGARFRIVVAGRPLERPGTGANVTCQGTRAAIRICRGGN